MAWGWNTVEAIIDVKVEEFFPDTNYEAGALKAIQSQPSGTITDSYLMFTVPCQFISASLVMWCDAVYNMPSADTVQVLITGSNWEEDVITWNTGKPSDTLPALEKNWTNAVFEWKNIDITEVLKGTFNAGDTFSIRLLRKYKSASTVGWEFNSSEEAQKPYVKFFASEDIAKTLSIKYHSDLSDVTITVLELNDDPYVASTLGSTIQFTTYDNPSYDRRYPLVTPIYSTSGWNGDSINYSFWKHLTLEHSGPRAPNSTLTNFIIKVLDKRLGVGSLSGDYGCPLSSYDVASVGEEAVTGNPIWSTKSGSLGHAHYRDNGTVQWAQGTYTVDSTAHTVAGTFKPAVVQYYRESGVRTTSRALFNIGNDIILQCEDTDTESTYSTTLQARVWQSASPEKYVQVALTGVASALIKDVGNNGWKIENSDNSLPSAATIELTADEKFTLSLSLYNVPLEATVGVGGGTVWSHYRFNFDAYNTRQNIIILQASKNSSDTDVWASIYENGVWNSISGVTLEIGESLPESTMLTYYSSINVNNSFTWGVTVKQADEGESTVWVYSTSSQLEEFMSNVIAIKPRDTLASGYTFSAWDNTILTIANSEIFAGTDELGDNSMIRAIVVAENIDTSDGRQSLPVDWLYDGASSITYQLRGTEKYLTLNPIDSDKHTRIALRFQVPQDLSARRFGYVYGLLPSTELYDWYVNLGEETAPTWIKAYDFKISGNEAFRKDGVNYGLILFSRVNPSIETQKLWAKWSED